MSLICVFSVTKFNSHLIKYAWDNKFYEIILNYYTGMFVKLNLLDICNEGGDNENQAKLQLMTIKMITCFHVYMLETNMSNDIFRDYNNIFLFLAKGLTNINLENWFLENLILLIFWDGKVLD